MCCEAWSSVIFQGLFPYLLVSEIPTFLLCYFQSIFQILPIGSSSILINKAESCPPKQAALTLQHWKLQHLFLSRNVVMLWQQSTLIFQMIRESSGSHSLDHVLNFVIQPLTVLHADVSSPMSIRALTKYCLGELIECMRRFSPSCSLICTVPSEFQKTEHAIINLRFTRVVFKLLQLNTLIIPLGSSHIWGGSPEVVDLFIHGARDIQEENESLVTKYVLYLSRMLEQVLIAVRFTIVVKLIWACSGANAAKTAKQLHSYQIQR